MSEAIDWSWLRTSIPVIDMAMYLGMPEDIARTVEIRDGMIVHCESPSPNHVAISDNIKGALRDAVSKRSGNAPCLRASGELEMLVSEVPFHYKRPDAIVYRCIDEPRGKWKTKPTASDTLLVVEVVSPNTVTADLVEKRAEYARLGIRYYWIVRMVQDDGPAASIEMLRLTADGTSGGPEDVPDLFGIGDPVYLSGTGIGSSIWLRQRDVGETGLYVGIGCESTAAVEAAYAANVADVDGNRLEFVHKAWWPR